MLAYGLLDEEELESLLDFIREKSHPNMLIAEVGVYQGATSAKIADIISKQNGIILAIDIWENQDDFNQAIRFLTFYPDNIIPIKTKSHLIAPLLSDHIFDLVFLDANHHYSFIKRDIELWLPKVKKGGILCGHDCEKHYTEYSKEDQEAIELHKEDDKPGFSCHPGVIKALYDVFHDDYKTLIKRIWYKEIS